MSNNKVLVSKSIVERKFSELTKEDFEIMEKIYETATYLDPKRRPTSPEYSEGFSKVSGSVFFIELEGLPVGFSMCFDKQDFEKNEENYSYPSIFFRDSTSFLKELGEIGNFCFIMRIVIHKDFRNQGLGSYLIKEIEKIYTGYYTPKLSLNQSVGLKYPERENTVLLASTIPNRNFSFLSLLKKLGFSFIDHYQPSEEAEYLCRVIKVLDKKRVFKAVKPETLAESFKTFIPLQLNSETENINRVINKMGAEIIWSAFNKTDVILDDTFQLPIISMGFYGALLKGSMKTHGTYSNPTLTELLSYLKEYEEGTAPSLTEPLKHEAFELLILDHNFSQDYINREVRKSSFAFSSLVVLNINELTLEKLSEFPQLWPKKRLSSKRELRKIFMGLLHKKSHNKSLSEEEKETWKKFKTRCLLSDEKEKKLTDLSQLKEISSKEKHARREERRKLIYSLIYLEDEEIEKWQGWIDLHKALCDNTRAILQDEGKHKMWGHAVVPVSFSQGVKRMMFSFVVDKDSELEFIAGLVRMIASSLAKNMFNILLKLSNSVIENYLIRYSISRIMARNMSHSLGSHVLSTISSGDRLKSIIKDDWNPIEVEQLAAFNAYLRTRMDFIADISTSDPVVSIRRKINQEILQKFKQEDVVRHYISGTEIVCDDIIFINNTNSGTDPQVQIPNGELGKHALYIIIENIIRNSVKHARKIGNSGKNGLKIFVELSDENPKRDPESQEVQRFYKCLIYDNTFHINESGSRDWKIVDRINKDYIQPPIIGKNKSARTRGWGILEMKIAAAYLRKIPTPDIDRFNKRALLRAVKVQSKESPDSFYLGYEFFLKKPREILVVDTNLSVVQNMRAVIRVNSGIRIISMKELKTNPNNIFSHEFIFVLGKKGKALIQQNKVYPIRWIHIKNEWLIEKVSQQLYEDPEWMINYAWLRWLGKFLMKKEVKTKLHLEFFLQEIPISKFPTQPLNQLMIYDLHGKAIERESMGFVDTRKFSDPKAYYFYEPFGSVSPTGRLLTHLAEESSLYKLRLNMELFEAALTDVIILDERIQREVSSKVSKYGIRDSSFIEELAWSRVWIPTLGEVNLSCHEYYEEVLTQMNNWIQQMSQDCHIDFIVFHMGLLEKLIGDLDLIASFLEETIFCKYPHLEVILTSGRGKPHDIPPNTRFLHYSNVAQYVIQEKSKYHLCKLLFSARTRERNNE